MGYSSTAIAGLVLQALIEKLQGPDETTSNSWTGSDGRRRFYEIGRENRDGSITGSVLTIMPDNTCRPRSFRISSDGVVERFPGASADMRHEACIDGYRQMVESFGRCQADRHCSDEDHPAHHLADSMFLIV